MPDFVGSALPLTQSGVDAVGATAAIDAACLWAVISVETSGCGFLPDRRPKILFERHIFSRLTGGKFDADDPDVSAPTPGGYGPSGAHQYLRLQSAMQLNQAAALQSASWGLGQVMGENYKDAGFDDVNSMIAAAGVSEDAQLQSMAAYISAMGMTRFLTGHDWSGFARCYNGPNYAANNYDGLLQHFYGRYATGPTPDLTIRAAQIYLTYKGFAPGPIDGVAGPDTETAVKNFQKSAGCDPTGAINDALLQQLAN